MKVGSVRDLGEGRWIRAEAAMPGGWWLTLMEGGDRAARVRLKPDDYRRICNGKVTSEGEVEIRGMRTEVEFRLAGRFLGRLEKTSFGALIDAAEAAREP